MTREVELRGAGLVITHRISPTDDTAVAFRVVDTLASNVDIDDLGFHPAFEPSGGRMTPKETVIEGIVEPGYAREIVSGICPAQPKPPADVRQLHESVQPTIASSQPWNKGTRVQSDPVSRTEAGRTKSLFGRIKRRLFGEARGTQPQSGPAERPADPTAADEPRRQDAIKHLDDVFTAPEVADTGDPSSGSEPADASTVDWDEFWGLRTSEATGSRPEGEPDSLGSVPGATNEWAGDRRRQADHGVWPNLQFESETISQAHEEYRTFAEIFADIGFEPTHGESTGSDSAELDVATQLIDELGRNALRYGKRRRLAQELLDETTRSRLPSADLDHRVEGLGARIDELSDFTDVLGATIDTHGSAQEYVNDMTSELEELASSRRRVRRRLDRASSERDRIQEQLEAVTERTTRIESKIDRLGDRESAIRSRLERTFSNYETGVSRLESVTQTVDAMVSDVQSMRESLAE